MDDDLTRVVAPHISDALGQLQRGQDVQQVLGALAVLFIIGLGIMVLFMRRDHKQTMAMMLGMFESHRKDVLENVDKALSGSRDRFTFIEAAVDAIEKRLDNIMDRLRDFGLQVLEVYREAMGLAKKDDPPKT